MAYRSFGRFRQASTHLDTPPFSQSHHPVSAIALREASAAVLNGFELLTDVVIVRYLDRYMDKRGTEAMALRHLDRVERKLCRSAALTLVCTPIFRRAAVEVTDGPWTGCS